MLVHNRPILFFGKYIPKNNVLEGTSPPSTYISPAETGLYYLNSRYYDPETGRFINADDTEVLSLDQNSVIENNLFAYGLNNPVNMEDSEGYAALAIAYGGYMATAIAVGGSNFWNPVGWVITGAIIGVVVGHTVYYLVESYKNIKASKSAKAKTKTKKKAKKSGKEKANDATSWAKKQTYNPKKTADQNATDILNKKYGKGNWKNSDSLFK